MDPVLFDSNFMVASLTQANAFYDGQQFESALPLFTRAVCHIMCRLARCYRKTNDTTRALESVSYAIRTDGGSSGTCALVERATIHYARNDHKLCVQDLSDAITTIRSKPTKFTDLNELASYFLWRIRIHTSTKDYQSLQEDAKSLLALSAADSRNAMVCIAFFRWGRAQQLASSNTSVVVSRIDVPSFDCSIDGCKCETPLRWFTPKSGAAADGQSLCNNCPHAGDQHRKPTPEESGQLRAARAVLALECSEPSAHEQSLVDVMIDKWKTYHYLSECDRIPDGFVDYFASSLSPAASSSASLLSPLSSMSAPAIVVDIRSDRVLSECVFRAFRAVSHASALSASTIDLAGPIRELVAEWLPLSLDEKSLSRGGQPGFPIPIGWFVGQPTGDDRPRSLLSKYIFDRCSAFVGGASCRLSREVYSNLRNKATQPIVSYRATYAGQPFLPSQTAAPKSHPAAVSIIPYSEFGSFTVLHDERYSTVRRTSWRGRDVVLKELKPILNDTALYDEWLFSHESMVCASLQHPNIVQLLAVCDSTVVLPLASVDAKILPPTKLTHKPSFSSSDGGGGAGTAAAVDRSALGHIWFNTRYELRPPWAIAEYDNSSILIADARTDIVRLWVPDAKAGGGRVEEFAATAKCTFDRLRGVCVDSTTNRVYVCDRSTVRLIHDGVVTVLAGSGKSGFKDGKGITAMFDGLADIKCVNNGRTLIVSDGLNNRIRSIDVQTGAVITVAGDGQGRTRPGTGVAASLHYPRFMSFDRSAAKPTSVLFVTCDDGAIVRLYLETGVVERPFQRQLFPRALNTLSGGRVLMSCYGSNDLHSIDMKTGSSIQLLGKKFTGTSGLIISKREDSIFVADHRNCSILQIPLDDQADARKIATVARDEFKPRRAQYAIVTEFVGGGTLFSYLRDRPSLRLSDRLHLLIQLAEAVTAMHARDIVHRDIKPSNALITTDGPPILKLADFGLSRYVKGGTGAISTEHARAGTLNYMAPEQANEEPTLTAAVDVHAFGGVLYFILFQIEPWTERKERRTDAVIIAKLISGKQPPLPPDYNPKAVDSKSAPGESAARAALIELMNRCYKHAPSERPRMVAVLNELYAIFDRFMWPARPRLSTMLPVDAKS